MYYTEEQIEYIRQIVPGRQYQESRKMFNDKYGTNVSQDAFRHTAKRFGVCSGFTGRFEKGQPSHNKGKKITPEQYEKIKGTMFKPGMTTHNHKELGSERVTVEGYVEIKTAEPNIWQQKHVWVWEKENGPVPEGMCLIFKDGNKQNTDISNLMMISRSEQLIMNKYKLRSNDPKLTETGVLVSKLILKTGERKRKAKKRKQKGKRDEM